MTVATDTGLVPMRVSKAVGLKDGDEISELMVLDAGDGDRHMVIQVGHTEAVGLVASLQGLQWGRPMTMSSPQRWCVVLAAGSARSGWAG